MFVVPPTGYDADLTLTSLVLCLASFSRILTGWTIWQNLVRSPLMPLYRICHIWHNKAARDTDRSTFRCAYCMPKDIFGPDHPFLPRDQLRAYEEIYCLVHVFVAHGVNRTRLAGGEPAGAPRHNPRRRSSSLMAAYLPKGNVFNTARSLNSAGVIEILAHPRGAHRWIPPARNAVVHNQL